MFVLDTYWPITISYNNYACLWFAATDVKLLLILRCKSAVPFGRARKNAQNEGVNRIGINTITTCTTRLVSTKL